MIDLIGRATGEKFKVSIGLEIRFFGR